MASAYEAGRATERLNGGRSPIPCIGPVGAIAIAQLLGTSLWFSANSTAQELMRLWRAGEADIGWLTSAVQLGFILGMLTLSLSGTADRHRASRIFVASAIAGAFFNAGFAWLSTGLASEMALRFCVGVCLAGIYPMGMKLIVCWAPDRTDQALAQLVAMLALGTADPWQLSVDRPISVNQSLSRGVSKNAGLCCVDKERSGVTCPPSAVPA